MLNTQQKKVYIIHGWDGNPKDGFKPWLKKELEARGFEVFIPLLPDAKNPRIESWIPFLKNYITNIDEDTILVGHSLGCQAILRFLSEKDDDKKTGRIIMVAGVFDKINNLSEEEADFIKPWLVTPIDSEKVKKSTNEMIAIFSDNDKWIPLESEKIAREKYNAKIIIEHNMGHFNEDDKIFKAPTVLQQIIG